jgi:hypothetical protein
MWFAYMDETGNTGRNLTDPSQPIHLVLTMAVEESKVRALHEHIRDTAREHCAGDCGEDNFEFHGKELFAAEGYFGGRSRQERIEIYDAVLAGIEIAAAEILIRGVSKPDLERRYAKPFHPHDIALMFTIESVERLARERNVDSSWWQMRPKRSRMPHCETWPTTRRSALPGAGKLSR